MAEITEYKPLWIRRLLIVVSILIVLGIVFRLFNPEQHPAQEFMLTNFNETTTQFSDLTYSGQPASMPPRLPTATGTHETLSENEVIALFSPNINFQTSREASNVHESSEFELTAVTQIDYYSMIKTNTSFGTGTIAPQQALNAAENFKETFFKDFELTLLEDETQYFSGDLHVEPSSVQEATIMVFAYSTTINGYPVVLGHDSDVVLRVWVNNSHEVIKTELVPHLFSTQLQRSYDTISVYQAIENINQGMGSVAQEEYLAYEPLNLETRVSGDLTAVKLEYRLDTTTGSVVPYYRFIGELTNDQNQTFPAHVITPAIVTDFSRQVESPN